MTDPTCTFVIPTHNRPRQLSDCLDAVAALDYPRELVDVIVVGDGYGPVGHRPDATFIHQDPRGPSPARNEGVCAASGDLIAFMDDDCRPARDWLRRLVESWRREPTAAVGGYTVNALAGNRYARASQVIIDIGYRQNGDEPNAARFFTTNNMVLTREQFLAIGGFDETFWTSEDRDLADRWLERGWPMRYEPEALIFHGHAMGLRGYVRQHFEYGRGSERFWRKRAESGRGGLDIDPDFYLTVARAPLRADSRRLELALMLLLWHLINTVGFLYERRRARRGLSPIGAELGQRTGPRRAAEQDPEPARQSAGG